jgi:hypothetical protein
MTSDETRGDRFTEWLVAAPRNVAILLGVIAFLWAVPTAYFAPGVLNSSSISNKSDKAKDAKDTNATTEEKLGEKEAKAAFDPNRTNKVVAFTLGLAGVVSCGLLAMIWVGGYPTLPAAERRPRARVMILAVAAFTGLLLMLGGAWFTTDQFEIVKKWLETKSSKNLWKVLTPVLVFIVGAAVAFAGAHFARADERHNQLARRLVYATHFGVTALLLFLILVIANVFFGAKLPNKLDTTTSSTFTLHPSTEKYLQELNQKVTVYAIIDPDRATAQSLRVMLANCQEANPRFFVVQRVTSLAQYQELKARFPAVPWSETALLITLGEDEVRYGTVKPADLEKAGQGTQRFFQGEVQLMKELLFISENKVKPTIYFTQDSGELAIEAGERRASPERSATALKTQLEAANLNVQPLKFDKKNPKIPDDAALVVILDPTVPLSEELVGALRQYMMEKGANGKTGRLFVATSPRPNLTNDDILQTGLEPLLHEFNVDLVGAYLYSILGLRFPLPEHLLLDAYEAQEAGQPISSAFADQPQPFAGPHRPIATAQPGNPAFRVTPLLQTTSAQELVTWLEKSKVTNFRESFSVLAKSPELQASKKLTVQPRAVAVAVSEVSKGQSAGDQTEIGRAVVFGSSAIFNDANSRQRQGAMSQGTGILTRSIDWLRDRPNVEVVNKEVGYWKVPGNFDITSGMFLPFGLMLLTITLVAIGVWVVRRR